MALAAADKLIVFTDLDGTLLDHETYSFEAARPCLDRLKKNNVPVIFTTSKTFAEVSELQAKMGIKDACIVENGCAVYLNDDEARSKVFGPDYSTIRNIINDLPKDLRAHLQGFGDMSVEEVAASTGLALAGAQKAKQRLASEPFLWAGSKCEFEELASVFRAAGVHILQGGRFYHALGDVNKAKAIDWMMGEAKTRAPGTRFHACALGDGPNDKEMILACDTGVVIKNPHGVSLGISPDTPNVIFSAEVGPKGWAQTLHDLMDQLNLER